MNRLFSIIVVIVTSIIFGALLYFVLVPGKEEGPQVVLLNATMDPDILFEEREQFWGSGVITAQKGSIKKSFGRSLKDYYQMRSFPGGPPIIPHAVTENFLQDDFNTCLGCHKNGGYALIFEAYTPLTPHPHMENCGQCHVPDSKISNFKPIDWQSVRQPMLIGKSTHQTPPPHIPHGLQLRENCLGCHGGSAAVPELMTAHPERVHCMQCHVELTEVRVFSR